MAQKPTNEGKAVTEKPSAKRDDPKQSERFIEAAREHGAATTEEAARRAFRKVVGKPKPRDSKR
jgi:hypothetical protein